MSPSCVVDTVILLYFLLAGEADLLLDTVGSPLGTPRVVFDPDEGDVPATARSEITRSIAYHERAATDPARDAAARDLAAANTKRLRVIAELHRARHLEVIDLASTELEIFGTLTSQSGCGAYGLRFPLGYGEAACLAIALVQNLPLATDDRDALRALHHESRQPSVPADPQTLDPCRRTGEDQPDPGQCGTPTHDRPRLLGQAAPVSR